VFRSILYHLDSTGLDDAFFDNKGRVKQLADCLDYVSDSLGDVLEGRNLDINDDVLRVIERTAGWVALRVRVLRTGLRQWHRDLNPYDRARVSEAFGALEGGRSEIEAMITALESDTPAVESSHPNNEQKPEETARGRQIMDVFRANPDANLSSKQVAARTAEQYKPQSVRAMLPRLAERGLIEKCKGGGYKLARAVPLSADKRAS
jgi:hypothetical protein